MSEFVGPGTLLTEQDFSDAAQKLHCDQAAIQAVAKVESSGKSGFLPNNRPKILFESRWFHKRTNGQFDQSNPDLSTPKWVRNYAGGSGEYSRLEKAITLDRTAALESTSWGKFQVLGINCKMVGYSDVEEFVAAQVQSEAEHLSAFVNFVISKKLDDELRDRRWADFAKTYNGPGYKQNHYDTKMAEAYAMFAGGVHAPTVLEIQQALNGHGASLTADGITGPATRGAIRVFQEAQGLVADGIAGPATLAALGLGPSHDPIAFSNELNG